MYFYINDRGEKDLCDPPRRTASEAIIGDARFLAHAKTFAYEGIKGWVHTGYKWVEAFWDGKKFRIWCGKESTFTTEHLDFKYWTTTLGYDPEADD